MATDLRSQNFFGEVGNHGNLRVPTPNATFTPKKLRPYLGTRLLTSVSLNKALLGFLFLGGGGIGGGPLRLP